MAFPALFSLRCLCIKNLVAFLSFRLVSPHATTAGLPARDNALANKTKHWGVGTRMPHSRGRSSASAPPWAMLLFLCAALLATRWQQGVGCAEVVPYGPP